MAESRVSARDSVLQRVYEIGSSLAKKWERSFAVMRRAAMARGGLPRRQAPGVQGLTDRERECQFAIWKSVPGLSLHQGRRIALDHDRYDGDAARLGDVGGAAFEGSEDAPRRARAFGKEDHGSAAPDSSQPIRIRAPVIPEGADSNGAGRTSYAPFRGAGVRHRHHVGTACGAEAHRYSESRVRIQGASPTGPDRAIHQRQHN